MTKDKRNVSPLRLDGMTPEEKRVLSLHNDRILTDVLNNNEVIYALVRDITGKMPESVVSIDPQVEVHIISNDTTPACVYDIIVDLGSKVVDIELQHSKAEFPPTRARMYSSLLDYKYFGRTGDDKYDIDESYVVILAGFAATSDPVAIQHFVMQDSVTGTSLNDGRHIIYVNYKRWNAISADEVPMIEALCRHLAGVTGTSQEYDIIDNTLSALLADVARRNQYMTFERELELQAAASEKVGFNKAIIKAYESACVNMSTEEAIELIVGLFGPDARRIVRKIEGR